MSIRPWLSVTRPAISSVNNGPLAFSTTVDLGGGLRNIVPGPGNTVYAGYNPGTVYTIDGTTNAATFFNISGIPFGGDVAFNSATNRLYYVDFNGPLRVIDVGSKTQIGTLTAQSPRFVNNVTNRLYCPISAYSPMTLEVRDGNTHAVLSTIAVAANFFRTAVNTVTNRLYGTYSNSNVLTVIDGATNAVSSVTIGTDFISGVAVNTSTNRIYALSSNGSTVTLRVISGSNNSLIASTVLGTDVNGSLIAVDSVNNTVYVSRTSGISVINGATNAVSYTTPGPSGGQFMLLNSANRKLYLSDALSAFISPVSYGYVYIYAHT